MKMIAPAIGLAMGLATPLFAGETLRLKLEPDHEYLLSGAPREVVVKIDLWAADQRQNGNGLRSTWPSCWIVPVR